LVTKANLIDESTEYIEEVVIYLRNLDKFIIVKGGHSTYVSTDLKIIEGLIKSKTSQTWQFYDHHLYIVTMPFTFSNELKDIPYVIYSRISTESLFSNIRNFQINESSTSMLSLESYNIFLTNQKNEKVFKKAVMNEFKINNMYSYNENNEEYLVMGYHSKYLNATYAQAIPTKTVYSEIYKFRRWYYIFSLVICMTVFVYITFTYRSIKKPLNILLESFADVEIEKFNKRIKHNKDDEFTIVFEAFNQMSERIKTMINDVYLQKILLQKAELRQLQAQINPHFLYNSFFILKNRISSGSKEDAEKFCEMMGSYFSYITKNYKDYSTLKEEVKFARIYAEIQGIRFIERMEIHFDDLEEKYEHIKVPKLIIQPILENAFKYGLENKEFEGVLQVRFAEHDGYLQIIVEDNGDNYAESSQKIRTLNELFVHYEQIDEPSGLLNINRRLKIFYGNECGINVMKSEELGGLKVILSLKLLCREEMT